MFCITLRIGYEWMCIFLWKVFFPLSQIWDIIFVKRNKVTRTWC